MLGAAESGGRRVAKTKMVSKLGGHVCFAFFAQSSEDGQVVRPGHDRVAEHQFGLTRHLLMSGVVESRG